MSDAPVPYNIGTQVVHQGGELGSVVPEPERYAGRYHSASDLETLKHLVWFLPVPGNEDPKPEPRLVRTIELRPYIPRPPVTQHGSASCRACGADYPHVHDRKGFPHAVETPKEEYRFPPGTHYED